MVDAAPNPTPSETRRFPIGLPQPLWIGLATVVLAIIGIGLRFGCRFTSNTWRFGKSFAWAVMSKLNRVAPNGCAIRSAMNECR